MRSFEELANLLPGMSESEKANIFDSITPINKILKAIRQNSELHLSARDFKF